MNIPSVVITTVAGNEKESKLRLSTVVIFLPLNYARHTSRLKGTKDKIE